MTLAGRELADLVRSIAEAVVRENNEKIAAAVAMAAGDDRNGWWKAGLVDLARRLRGGK